MALAVGTMLLRTRDELGTPVPDPVLRSLLPSPWRTTMHQLDRAFPVAPSTRRWGNPASLLTRATANRVTPLGAIGDAASGATRRGRDAFRTRSIERRERTQDGGASHDLHIAEGGADDRAAYLAEVARAARPIIPPV